MSERKGLSFGPLVRRDMRFSGSPAGILVEALDYHSDPVHLTRQEVASGEGPIADGRSL